MRLACLMSLLLLSCSNANGHGSAAPPDAGASRGAPSATKVQGARTTAIDGRDAGARVDGAIDEDGGGPNAACRSFRQSRVLGSADTAAAALAVTARSTLVFVAEGERGIQAFDTSDLGAITQVALVETPGEARGLDVEERYLYVADGTAGLVIVDVDEPATPVIAGSVDTPGSAREVRVEAGVAYVADGTGGLQIIDVSDPSTPRIVSSVPTDGGVMGARVSEGLAYIAEDAAVGHDGSLRVIDVRDPNAPVVVSTLIDEVIAAGLSGVDVHHQRAYLLTKADGVGVVDLRAPRSPNRVGALCYGPCGASSVVYAVGDRAFYAVGEKVVVADVSALGQERNVAAFDVGGPVEGIFVHGQRIYVAAGAAGLKVARLEGPFPGISGVAELEEAARTLAVIGSRAVVGHGERVDVVDVGSAWAMTLESSASVGATVLSAAVVGDRVALGTSRNDVRFVSVSDPRAPIVSGPVAVPGDSNGLFARGSQLFVAYGARRGGVAIIDVDRPGGPAVAGTMPLRRGASEVAVYQDRAYVTLGVEPGEGSELEVIDVGDPSSILSLGHMALAGDARGVAAGEGVVIVGIGRKGEHVDEPRLEVIDVHDSGEPRVISAVALERPISSIQLVDGFAFCASLGEGLVVVDVRRPREPAVVAVVNHLGNRDTTDLDAVAVAVSGRFAYLIAADELVAIELCGPPWRREDVLTRAAEPADDLRRSCVLDRVTASALSC